MASLRGSAGGLPSHPPEKYSVGWICAIHPELIAATAMLDSTHGPLTSQPKHDGNNYTLGSIGGHNVVIACLPQYGTNNAAVAGISMQRTFPNLRFGVMVGIGGGVPSDENDIRLGDIAVSLPSGQASGVIQYDMGKREDDGFHRTGSSLDRPPTLLLTAIQTLRATPTLGREITEIVNGAFADEEDEEWRFPEKEEDILYKDGYDSLGISFRNDEIIRRDVRKNRNPNCFYGNIGSGNSVIKNAKERHLLATKEGVICFEMEAAGLMNFFKCIVIRGICDYADKHKHKKWQPYAAAVAAAYAKKLLCVISPESVEGLECSKGHWCIPFGRNKQFIGRESEFQDVISKLTSKEYEDECPRVALTGLGGIGKTQIALKVAFQIREKYPDCSVFWVPAVTPESFDAAFLEIGQKCKVPFIDKDKADVKLLVKAYLSQEIAGRWLLIVDNADDLDMLYKKSNKNDMGVGSLALVDYLPSSNKGSILFTTRNHKVAVKAVSYSKDIVAIREMTKSDSMELLETSLIQKGKAVVEEDATKLLRVLEYLPLAIKQATAYINAEQIVISEYLEMYESSDQDLVELLSEEFEDQGRYNTLQNPIASTWLISFRQIQNDNRLAVEYLYIMSCVAPRDIPRSLLPPASPPSKVRESRAIGTLKAYAFITELEGENTYDIHRLVQLAVRNWLKEDNQLSRWRGETLKQVARIFPFFKHENRNQCTAYLPHTQYILGFSEFSADFQDSLRKLLFNIGEYFRHAAKYIVAENMYQQTLELTKKALGDDHPSTLGSMNNLAMVYEQQGKYIEAEKLQQQTLELKKKALGDDHPSTLSSMNNLAIVYEQQGKFIEAEKLQQQALELTKKALGDDHPSTLGSMNNLAMVYEQQGKYIEAEKLQQQTLELTKKALGDDHPSTLGSMNNLAMAYEQQGKYIEAEKLHQQTLELTKKALGDDHPSTLGSMNNLAILYRQQGKYIEAEELQQQTLELKKKALGDDHPSTLSSMNNLAMVYEQQGKYIEAEELQQQTLELKKKALGDDHPSTLSSMYNLAILYRQQGKYVEAEGLQQQTLELTKKAHGDDDDLFTI